MWMVYSVQLCAWLTSIFFCKHLSLFSLNKPLEVTLDEYRFASIVMLYTIAVTKTTNVIANKPLPKNHPYLTVFYWVKSRTSRKYKNNLSMDGLWAIQALVWGRDCGSRERRFKEAWLEGWRAKWTCLQEIWGNLVKLLPQASISSSLIWWYEKGAVPAIEYVLILFTFYYQSTWKVERSHISHNKQNKRGKMKHSIHTARAHSEIKPG